MSDNRDPKFDLFPELPDDMRAVIIGLSAADPQAFSNLLQTSKEVAAKVMRSLTNPFVLLRLLCTSSPIEKIKLMQLHFSPDTNNYRSIEYTALRKGGLGGLENLALLHQQAAIICFALMMNGKYSQVLPHDTVMGALNALKEFAINSNQDIPDLDSVEEAIMMRVKVLSSERGVYRLNPSENEETIPSFYVNLGGMKVQRYLHNADLRCWYLRNADLSNTHLCYANLENLDLTGAIFDGANFGYANCNGIFAENASFKNLQNNNLGTFILTTFIGAKLAGASFSGTRLDRIDFSNADLRNVDFSNTVFEDMRGSSFTNANLEGANFRKAKIEVSPYHQDEYWGIDLSGLNFKSSNFSEAIIKHVRMVGANFSGADFSATDMRNVGAEKANFSGANLRGADMRAGNFEGADFTGANLQYAQLINVNFKNAKLDHVQFIPDEAYEHVDYLKAALEGFQNLPMVLYDEKTKDEIKWAIRKAVYEDIHAHTKNPKLIEMVENHSYFKGMKVELIVEEVKKKKDSLMTSITNFFGGKSSESSSQNKDKAPEKKGGPQ